MIKWIALGALAALVLLFIFLPTVAWILVGLVLLILAVVLLVPVGADVAYVGGTFSLAARVDGFALQLLPRKPADPNKPPKKKQEKPKQEKPPEEPKPKKEAKPRKLPDFTKEELLELVKKAIEGLGKFGKITVRRFMLHYAAAGYDPYDTAMTYNYVNAALCVLAPICANTFHVAGETDVRTEVDFTTEKTRIDFALSVTIRLIQVVRAGLAVAFGALGVLLRNRRRRKREARLAKENGAAEQNTVDQAVPDNDQATPDHEIKQPEERNDFNG